MKINSIQKIEKQAEVYTQKEYIPDAELKKLIAEYEHKLIIARKDLHAIRDKCSGSPCICKTLPGYYEAVAKVEPVSVTLDQLYRQEYFNRKLFHNKILSKLVRAREAKLKYYEN